MDEQNEIQMIGVLSKGYGIMPKIIVLDENLSLEAKGIYSFLTSFSGQGQGVFPSVNTILKYLKISENRYYKYRKELVDNGYITVQPRYEKNKRISNLYTLHMEKSVHLQNKGIQNKGIQFEGIQNKGNNNNNINNNNINNNNIKNKKDTEFDLLIQEFTKNEELKNALYEFIKMRASIKANLTTLGLKKIINRLETLATNDVDKIHILDNSIMNSWKGVFPLKTDNKNNITQISNKNERRFNNFESREYDYDSLEKQLLGWDKEDEN